MSLYHLLTQLQQYQPIRELRKSTSDVTMVDMPDAVRPALVAIAATSHSGPTVVVTSRRDRAELLASALSEYLPTDIELRRWSPPDAIPYEQLPLDYEASVDRANVLGSLINPSTRRTVIVTPVAGLMRLVTPPSDFHAHTRVLRAGDRVSMSGLLEWATSVGYQVNPMVQEPGSIARRGGIIDIFPPGHDEPIRIDFFGDDIESIRRFDPHSQRSTQRIQDVRLSPPLDIPTWSLPSIAGQLEKIDASSLRPEVRDEWRRMVDHVRDGVSPASPDLFAGYLMPQRSSILSYLSPIDTRIVLDGPSGIAIAAEQLRQQASELERNFVESGELPSGLRQPFLDVSNVNELKSAYPTLSLGTGTGDESEQTSLSGISDPPLFGGRTGDMLQDLRGKLHHGWRIVLATDQVDRLTELLNEHDVTTRIARKGEDQDLSPVPVGMVELRPSNLTSGWSWNRGKVAVWTDLEVFGFRKQPRTSGRRAGRDVRSFVSSLTPGEHVVHVDHGIARFSGLVRMSVSGIEREYLLLEYQRGDKLYVPVDQSDRVTRYAAGGAPTPQLNKLGSGDWVKTRRRVRRAVRDMAFELIQLYAYRDAGKGFGFPPDTKWDVDLAESFPYEETPDQASAITSVTTDMESYRPMDRLVCGDVGFGKTEVAIRAAFKAANAGKQVAILVPTTILALQHYETFRQRMAAFPISIEMMSRLRTRKQQEETISKLKSGAVDIVIGTHRLVQKDIAFKDLGLVIVDEEQRFGVRQKEFLKSLRTEVDVLSMSATPIPRTLHMSLSGIRDISMIETAPQARLPIRTFVTPFTDQLVREVVLREMDRGGQVYVVHNRVHDIDRLANHLREIIPEARFGVGHGQMDESVLEEVMLGFVRHEFDVLISTTIIESGVDIPNVNTIIIDNADTLGLTQLYQLRGRVGRGINRAYAYLLYQPHKRLSVESQERLETIQEATELGAGLRVAMRDLEIRGAGNILGAEQSGHIASIGYELYMRLLSQAVEEIRSGQPAMDRGPVTLDLPMTALIPEDYIQDAELRLSTYRQIASVEHLTDVQQLQDDLEDRFGPIPEEVEHLTALIRLRIRAERLGIDSVVERERTIIIRPVETRSLNRERLERTLGGAIRFSPTAIRIRLLDLTVPWQEAVNIVLEEIERVIEPAAALPSVA